MLKGILPERMFRHRDCKLKGHFDVNAGQDCLNGYSQPRARDEDELE